MNAGAPDQEMNAADAVLGPALVAGYGDSPALLWRDRAITYKTLDGEVNRAANLFAVLGLAPHARVAMMMRDTPELVACYLGAMRAGGVSIAVNTRLAPADLAHILNDSEAEILLIDRDFLPIWHDVAHLIEQNPKLVVADADGGGAENGLAARLAAQSSVAASVLRTGGDMAFWVYTSGTTGKAKAAVHCHKDVLYSDHYVHETLGVRHGDILFATSKLFFAYALGTTVFASFRLGATTVLCDQWPDPEIAAGLVARYKPSVVFSVPTLYRNMLEMGGCDGPGFADVRHYVSAGERLPEALWQRWKDATGVEILDGMGTSETVYMLLTNRPGHVMPGSSGTIAPGAEAKCLTESGSDAGAGKPGVLWVKIPSLAMGYWKRDDLNATVFQNNWFCTGDIYSINEKGHWFHQGRHDDMIKVSGQWVSPAEIEEAALADTRVADCIATGAPDRDGLPRIQLFVVTSGGSALPSPGADALREGLAGRLAPWKVPKWITVVDEIPRTATGKAQRYKLREQFPPPA